MRVCNRFWKLANVYQKVYQAILPVHILRQFSTSYISAYIIESVIFKGIFFHNTGACMFTQNNLRKIKQLLKILLPRQQRNWPLFSSPHILLVTLFISIRLAQSQLVKIENLSLHTPLSSSGLCVCT